MMIPFFWMFGAVVVGYGSTLLLVTTPISANESYRESIHMIAAVMMVIALCAAFAGGYGVQ